MADAKITISAVDNTKAGLTSAANNLTALSTGFLAATKGAGMLKDAAQKAAQILVELTKNGINATDELQRFTTLLGDENQAKSLLGAMDKLDDMTLATKDDLSSFSQELVTMGKNQSEIQQILTATVNLSNTSGRSFTEVQSAMERAMAGSTTAIEKMLPELKDLSKDAYNNGDAFKYMNDKLGEASVTIASGSFSQKLDAISTSWTRIKETIGGVIVANIESTGILDKMYTTLLGIEAGVSGGVNASAGQSKLEAQGIQMQEIRDAVKEATMERKVVTSQYGSPYAATEDKIGVAKDLADQYGPWTNIGSIARSYLSTYKDFPKEAAGYWQGILDATKTNYTTTTTVSPLNSNRLALNTVMSSMAGVDWSQFSADELNGLASSEDGVIGQYFRQMANRKTSLPGKYSTYQYSQDETLLGNPTKWAMGYSLKDSAFASGYAGYLTNQEEKQKEQEEESAKLHAKAMSDILSSTTLPDLMTNIDSIDQMNTEETVEAITAGANIITGAVSGLASAVKRWADGYDSGDIGGTISDIGSIVGAFDATWGAAISAGGSLISAGESLFSSTESSTSSTASIQTATYNGATTIHINNYFDGSYIVGSGGMAELANILSDEMSNQAYTRTNA